MTGALPFVARDREIALLRTALDAALAGQGNLALISGEAGIGKTTLAERLGQHALQHGALLLTGRCYDLTETAPFAPWIELFSTYSANGSLPELPPQIARCQIGDELSNQTALFAAIHTFLATVAQVSPLVLLLDDQHWADDASLDLLRYLARHTAHLPLYMLVTYRSAELSAHHHLSQLLPLLVREAPTLRLRLAPLSSDDLWAIIRPRYQLAANDEARLTSYLYHRTEGNPFFTGELLQTLEEDGVLRQETAGWVLGDLGQVRTPLLVEQIISGRLASLTDADQQLLAVAAVLGQELSLAHWSEVAETSEDTLVELIERASRARLLSETTDGRGARFAHTLVRQVIYEQLAPSRRRHWHQRAGSALAAAATSDPDAVANHFRRSGDPRAAAWLIRAGERAERAYSWQAAADRFEAAVTALREAGDAAEQQGWLLVRIARMRRYAAPEDGLARLEEADRIATLTGDLPLAATVQWQSGLLHCLKGSIQEGLDRLERGVAALAALSPPERDRLLAFEPVAGFLPDAYHDQGTLAMWLSVAGRYGEATEYAEPYASDSIIPDGAEGAYGDAYVAFARARAIQGCPEESREAYARARSAYGDGRHDVQLARAMLNELQMRVLTYEADDLTERRRLEAEAESAWKRGSGAPADSVVGAMRMPLQYIEGGWSEMRSTALELRSDATSSMRAEAVYWLGPVVHAQGDTHLAWELVEEWLPAGPVTAPGDTFYRTAQRMQLLAAELAIEVGDFPTARRWIEAGGRWLAWSGAVLGKVEHALAWAAYHRARDDLEEARRQAEIALRHASNPRQPLALLAAHRMLGALDTSDGRYGEAAANLDVALTLAEACIAPYERALTLLALAELDLAQSNVGDAAVRLAAASIVFESLDAKPALAWASALAARLDGEGAENGAGAPAALGPAIASDQDRALLADLSPRELDVLRLLPAGNTNQEIADLLFLSPKTVEFHIGRILAKTNLPNRAAAAAFAQRAGLT